MWIALYIELLNEYIATEYWAYVCYDQSTKSRSVVGVGVVDFNHARALGCLIVDTRVYYSIISVYYIIIIYMFPTLRQKPRHRVYNKNKTQPSNTALARAPVLISLRFFFVLCLLLFICFFSTTVFIFLSRATWNKKCGHFHPSIL